jgi:hypothetical protein
MEMEIRNDRPIPRVSRQVCQNRTETPEFTDDKVLHIWPHRRTYPRAKAKALSEKRSLMVLYAKRAGG